MPRFKVALHRRIRENYHSPEPNPFLAPIPAPGVVHSMSIREWEFDAKDEDEVRRLLEEAREQGVANVAGYHLRSIERVCADCGTTFDRCATYWPQQKKCCPDCKCVKT
jgi:hypothetical protein